MLEFLVSWAEQLIVALIIIIMVELIIPNNSYRKYIKVILGIFIIYTICSPLISGEINKINFGETLSYEELETNNIESMNQIDYNKQIEEVYKEKLKETLIDDLKEKGYEAENIILDITYTEEEITVNKLEFKIKKFEQASNITIEKVQISQENDIDESKINELKEKISKTYDIPLSKISIESEN